MAAELDYVPMPDAVKSADRASRGARSRTRRARLRLQPRGQVIRAAVAACAYASAAADLRLDRAALTRRTPSASDAIRAHASARAARPAPCAMGRPVCSAAPRSGAALLTLALLAGILVSLVIGAWPAIRKYGLAFLGSSEWDPVQNEYGGLVMIYGTLMTSFIALLIAVPVSFGIALFLTELSPRWLEAPAGHGDRTARGRCRPSSTACGACWCSGRSSRTYVQQPLQKRRSPACRYLGALVSGPPVGIGILSAGIILAIMIIPFIASVMRDVFEVTPPMLKESAYGLGSTTWEVVSQGRAALHQDRRRRRHHAGPGPRARRDDGRHLRDRQHEPAQ